LSEKDALVFKQLMLALDYCHKLGVSSRDIKLENTLLEKAPGRPCSSSAVRDVQAVVHQALRMNECRTAVYQPTLAAYGRSQEQGYALPGHSTLGLGFHLHRVEQCLAGH
jgi:serine/threonine protein kinase